MDQKDILLKWQDFRGTVCDMLNHGEEVADDENLLHMGLSSIQTMKLINVSKKLGYRLSFEQLVKKPYLKDWQQLFTEESLMTEPIPHKGKKDRVNMHQPFPLTEVQHAYWVGRYDGQYLGNIGCHGYLEINVQHIDTDRLNVAWKKLQEHHPMLRSIFTEDGKQYILAKSQASPLIIHDFRMANEQQIIGHLEEMRNQTSHRLLRIEEGQVAELQITLLPENKGRLFFDIDLLVADVQSYQIILRDLVALYNRNSQPKAPLEWNFASYLARKNNENNGVEEAKAYWTKRLETLPTKPLLPVSNKSEIKSTFNRRSFLLNKGLWEKLQHHASKAVVTPAMVLLTIYSLVLNKWSENNHFLINIPLFNRHSTDELNIEDVVADFTTLLLLEVNLKEQRTFLQDVQMIQAQFHQDMQHTAYSGVDVQRDFNRKYGGEQQIAPIVFSCNIGSPLLNEEFVKVFGDIHYMISQTPQVWLDFQVFEQDNGLLLIWDSLDDIFSPHILDEMFASFTQALEFIVKEENWTTPLTIPIEDQLNSRKNVLTKMDIQPTSLHAPFFERADRNPDDIALVVPSTNMSITYGDLKEKALSITHYLRSTGIEKGDTVGILMERGINQIAAIFGILAVGGVYVPIGLKQPLSRRSKIYDAANISVVLTDQPQLDDSHGVSYLQFAEAEQSCPSNGVAYDPNSTAYIIFTSGSTGMPKGVEMTHEAAWNTIHAVNQLNVIDSRDSVLAVSATEFDLSVYDIFGLLAVGGKLILLHEDEVRSVNKWLQYIEDYNVTLWNSVPILFEMLCAELEHEDKTLPSIWKIYLSGDWIKPDLVKQMKTKTPNGKFTAMGGATEGGIWSNYYEVNNNEISDSDSIPYGYPLPNQMYRVVNERGEDCPNQVAGELWIGGKSIAKGYKGNRLQTKNQFVCVNGERWYRTGDYGRYSNRNIIEFLGRKDEQIKVNGHRIELEEIERSLKCNKNIKDAVVMANKQKNGNTLHAFITTEGYGEIFRINATSSDIPKLVQNVMTSIENGMSDEHHMEERDINRSFRREIDQLTCYGITFTLQRLDFPLQQGKVYDLNQLLEERNVDIKYTDLVRQWFRFMHKFNLVSTTDNIIYENICDLFNFKAPSLFNYPKLKEFSTSFIEKGQAIVNGELAATDLLFSKDMLTPMEVMREEPGALKSNQILTTFIHQISSVKQKWKRPLKILEIGARNYAFTEGIVHHLEGIDFQYTITDHSMYFKNEFKAILSENIEFAILDPVMDPILQGYQRNKYDIIIANNSLHRVENIPKSMMFIEQLLDVDGLMIVAENTHNHSLQLITTGFVEEGFTQFEDVRKEVCQPLLSDDEWLEVFNGSGFLNMKVINQSQLYSHHIFIAQSSAVKVQLDQKKLEDELKEQLPDYMIPQNITMLLKMPITNNGKLDRKLLKTSIQFAVNVPNEVTRPMNAVELKIANIWKAFLNRQDISLEDNFYQLGGDSLIATQLNSQLRKELKVPTSLEAIFKYPKFSEFADHISKNSKVGEKNNEETDSVSFTKIQKDTIDLYEPFPLTDIQQSYWLGRNNVYDLSNVSAHCYFELACGKLDMEAVTLAWNKLIRRHEVTRTVIHDNGLSQQIVRELPDYQIRIHDYRQEERADFEKGVLSTRNKMAQRQFDVSKWPLFEIEASLSQDQSTRLHVSFDNTVFDGYSIFLLFDEWYKLYKDPNLNLPSINISFRDYAIALADLKNSSHYEMDKQYWENRVRMLPPAPELPLVKHSNKVVEQKFTRYQSVLAKEKWKSIKQLAHQFNLTPSNVIMTAYAEVLGRYSKHQHFTLNLTHFNRLPLHADVDKLVGDFTSLVLVEMDHCQTNNFIMRCQDTQKQLLQDLEHTLVSGVEVQRMLRKDNNHFNDSIMPVVFTSGIGVNRDHLADISYLGKIVYGASQTPQVWLDHQVFEQDGELILSWDGVEELFPQGLLEEMFDVYTELLDRLSQGIDAWQQSSSLIVLPDYQQREDIHQASIVDPAEDTLVSLIEKQFMVNGSNTAIIDSSHTVTYADLDEMSKNIANSLNQNQTELVLILMEKGWEQIVSAIGIMRAGAAYLPVDVDTPIDRLNQMIEQAQVDSIITTRSLYDQYCHLDMNVYMVEELLIASKEKLVPLRTINADDLAYIIFTSGSTGMPKGVEITHGSVVNTIQDINKRFDVTSSDRSIALSNFTFDLSVYDAFGLLSAGGAIVIPDVQKLKDPEHWLELLHKYQITIWNTVPTFMEMLVDYHKTANLFASQNHYLKLILLSGDWIPLTLPDRIMNIFEEVNVVSLGGATECSIWSNYFVIDSVQNNWKSVPYGKSLSYQQLYVLNQCYEESPVWVSGDLYIGGIGLSTGYCNDTKKTKEHFIEHPITGERIYKTGDLARYLPDGNIEFLGRDDSQVKVNGHRIELGDIEASIRKVPIVEQAVVLKQDDNLIGHLKLNEQNNNKLMQTSTTDTQMIQALETVKSELEELVPTYDTQELTGYTASIEWLSVGMMYLDLYALKIFKAEEQEVMKQEVKGSVINVYGALMEHWLDYLVNYGFIAEKDAGYVIKYSKDSALHYMNDQLNNIYRGGTEESFQQLKEQLIASQDARLKILKGEQLAKAYLLESQDFLTPEQLGQYNLLGRYTEKLVGNMLEVLAKSSSKLNVLELGTRTGQGTDQFAKILKNIGEYTYSDESKDFLNRKKAVSTQKHVKYQQFDFNRPPDNQHFSLHHYDVIIAENTLHRSQHLNNTMTYLKRLLKPGGTILLTENVQNNALLLITVAFFEEGYQQLQDFRRSKKLPLLNRETWQSLWKDEGYKSLLEWPSSEEKWLGEHVMMVQGPEQIKSLSLDTFSGEVNNIIPKYMCPNHYFVHDTFPITANGKVDRQHLTQYKPIHFSDVVEKGKRAESLEEKVVVKVWDEILETAYGSVKDNFFEQGGDSLKAIRMINALDEQGYTLTLEKLFLQPTIEGFAANITGTHNQHEGEKTQVSGTL